jgi:hypothetical protein
MNKDGLRTRGWSRRLIPQPCYRRLCEYLRQLGWLHATSTTEALIFDLTDEARVADRSSRLMETAAEATN